MASFIFDLMARYLSSQVYVPDLHRLMTDIMQGRRSVRHWDRQTDPAMMVTTTRFELIETSNFTPSEPEKQFCLFAQRCIDDLKGNSSSGLALTDFQVNMVPAHPPVTYAATGNPVPTKMVENVFVRFEESLLNAQLSAQQAAQTLAALGAAFQQVPTLGLGNGPIEDRGFSVEPIVAYRDFYPSFNEEGEPRLYSRNGVVWPPLRKLRAFCRKNVGDIGEYNILGFHDAPNENCQCGIYAFDKADHHDMRQNNSVWGEVYLWGDVLICSSGYRAEYAYPKSIFIRTNGTKTAQWARDELERIYQVPTFLVSKKEGQSLQYIMDSAIRELLRGGESE